MSEIEGEQPPSLVSGVGSLASAKLVVPLACPFCGNPRANYASNDAMRQWLNLSTGRKDIKCVCNKCLSEAKKARRDSKAASVARHLAAKHKVKLEKRGAPDGKEPLDREEIIPASETIQESDTTRLIKSETSED